MNPARRLGGRARSRGSIDVQALVRPRSRCWIAEHELVEEEELEATHTTPKPAEVGGDDRVRRLDRWRSPTTPTNSVERTRPSSAETQNGSDLAVSSCRPSCPTPSSGSAVGRDRHDRDRRQVGRAPAPSTALKTASTSWVTGTPPPRRHRSERPCQQHDGPSASSGRLRRRATVADDRWGRQ